jgi:RNA polymerase sigma-70 factor, ECF subfamily
MVLYSSLLVTRPFMPMSPLFSAVRVTSANGMSHSEALSRLNGLEDDSSDMPAASFEPFRRRLLGLAYRMLGSMADAEDAVQESYLRWHGADRDNVSDPRAFLMTTTTRICLDMLTSARARHEEYVGPWLPEPVVDTAALAPDSRTELAEDLSIALLLTLDRLSPLERAAFLLHDVFDFSFSEVASALERSEAACRQLAARSRAHVREARPRGATTRPPRPGEIDAKHTQLLSAFGRATQSGDLDALMQLLATDVRVVTDGGGKVPAALNVIEGADRAARFLVQVTRKRPGQWWRDDFTVRFATVNGLPGVIVDSPQGPVQTAVFEIEGDMIRALYVVRNPDKLRHLAKPAPPHESDLD